MNVFAAWKKVALFGAFGAIGCLVGALIGEVHLFAANQFGGTEKAGRAPSLISKSTEPPPLPNDIRERIEAAGGKTGDVQISLIWYNVNDLDLHCEDPNREMIFYKRPRSRSGGELDVDANAGNNRDGRLNPITDKPVENIYWPKGAAPAGTYRVFVNHFAHRPEAGAPNETKFKVNVLHDGKRHEFEGTISNNGTSENMRPIYEFALNDKIELYVPNDMTVSPGTTVKVPVAVRRSFVRGAIEVKAENLPEGVTASKLTIPEGKEEGELELTATGSASLAKKPVKFVATAGNANSSADAQLDVVSRFSLWTVISTGIWTAFLAIGLCLALLAGQNKYVGKPLFAGGRVPLALVVLGAAVAGFVSGSVGQALFFVLISVGAAKIGLVLGWMLLGTLLGAGVSFFVPNLDAKKAALAGLAGGFLGAIAFLILASLLDTFGRFGGAISLGFCIGAMVAVVEVAFRRAWLEVRFGEREMITVNLGPEPVKIGGNASLCTVWARGAADVALRYWIREGKVQCEDVPSKRESVALAGDTRTVGSVTVVVRTSGTAAPTGTPPAPPVKPQAARPAPPLPPAVPVPPAPVSPPVPAKPQVAVPPKPPTNDYDDGLPMPLSPPPPARPVAKSILDFDDAPAVPAKPPAPAPTAKPPAPTPTAKPPAPPAKPLAVAPPAPASAPTVKPPAPPAPPAKPPATPAADACPTCGRKSPGRPGSRYCMVCDKTF